MRTPTSAAFGEDLPRNKSFSRNSRHKSRPQRSFSDLPSEILARIAAPMEIPSLLAASAVCRSWREALRPLREAMVLLCRGKQFKHGLGGCPKDAEKALDSFLQGAAKGYAAAMVNAGLMYWEIGKKEEAIELYRKAAELGYPTAQCNLGICCLEGDQPNPKEAVEWFYKSALSGYADAQYNLALCLHEGCGVAQDHKEAARWFLKAAESGNIKAMYKISLCYLWGEGLETNRRRSGKWMKLAADQGLREAQLLHGMKLFSSRQHAKALFYLELAARAGDFAARNAKERILETLSPSLRDQAISLADEWEERHAQQARY